MIRWMLPSRVEVSAGQVDTTGRYVVGNDGTLRINSTVQGDSGKYTCSARNVGGETTRSSDVGVLGKS